MKIQRWVLMQSLVVSTVLLMATDAMALAPTPGAGELLRFTMGGRLLGFSAGDVVVATGNQALRVEFVGASGAGPVAEGAATEPTGTVSGIEAKAAPMGRVSYPNLWEGITLVYDAPAGAVMRSTYTVAPGADPASIKLRYNAPVAVETDGSLKISFAAGAMRESAPVAWQEIEGRRIPVTVAFHQAAAQEVGFSLGPYDRTLPLMIDPTLTAWINTFLGGTSTSIGLGIAVDGENNIYVTGKSHSTWGSPLRAYTDSQGDAFVAKLDSTGNLVWNTFLGGNGEDLGIGIALDDAGNVYIAGFSDAAWGSPIREYSSKIDAFVVKLNSQGNIAWSTFLGGTADDRAAGISIDTNENIYVGGWSHQNYVLSPSDCWHTPIRECRGNSDGFVAKLDSSGTLMWNTFLGGSGYDDLVGIAAGADGNIYVTGDSFDSWGNPIQANEVFYDDGYVAKLNSNGLLVWNTFFGGNQADSPRRIVVGPGGDIYVTGHSAEPWGFPIRESGGAFAAKFYPSGILAWNTFLGSSGNLDSGDGIAIGKNEKLIIVGMTEYNSWGTPINPFAGNTDGFVAQLTTDGVLEWNSFLGGSGYDAAWGIALGSDDRINIVGHSTSSWGTGLPYPGTTVRAHSGEGVYNAFVAVTSVIDVAVLGIDVSTSLGTCGYNVTSTAHLKSEGNAGAHDFAVLFDIDPRPQAPGFVNVEPIFDVLGPGESRDYKFYGSDLLPGTYHLKVCVEGDYGESDWSDNCRNQEITLPPLSTVTVTAIDSWATELPMQIGANSTGTYRISRTGPTCLPLEVYFSPSGTATNGDDYTIASPQTIPANANYVDVRLAPVRDGVYEPTETAVMTLSANAAYIIGSPGSATISIENSFAETRPTVIVTATDSGATELPGLPPANTTGTYRISRTGGPTSTPLSVYFTMNGTATNGADYNLTSPQTIPAGYEYVDVVLGPIRDNVCEATEAAVLTLSANAYYAVGSPSNATITIADHPSDCLPVVTVTATDEIATEKGATTGSFQVTRTGPTTGKLTVFYAVSGTASAGSDYTGLTGSVEIPPGSATATITVTPVEDALKEGDETVVVTVSPNVSYKVGTPGTATVAILDKPTPYMLIQLDNASAGVKDSSRTYSGSWCKSGVAGSIGPDSLYSCGSGLDTYRWTPLIEAGGEYEVYVTWTTHVNRSDKVPISVTHAGGTTSRTFNQKIDGGIWVLHGTYSFAVGTGGYVQVSDANGQACADAVKFVPVVDGQPTVTITAGDATAAENPLNTGSFVVTRTGSKGAALTVNYTVGGSASAGSDYTALSGSVIIQAGSATGTIPVTPIDDAAVEADETVVATLSANAAYTVGTPGSATVTITSDDQTVGEIILDNAPAGTSGGGRSFTGSWLKSGTTGWYGADSLYSTAANSTYRWTPTISAAGWYEVWIWWTQHANRSKAVPIVVTHAGGTTGQTFDQTINGGKWVKHGTYQFNSGTGGFVQVAGGVWTSSTNTQQACADAVKFVPAAAPGPTEIILDNAPAGTSGGGRNFTGTWAKSSASGFYGIDSLYSNGSATDTYRWTPTIPAAGNYDVYVRWTAYSTRSATAPIAVTHAGGTTTRTYNQQSGGGVWVLHGTYSFSAGTGGYVEVSDKNGQACADAVRFVPALSVPCATNADCKPADYCEKPLGSCSAGGVCVPRPSVCVTLFLPVCGCNGQTYSNFCVAAADGVNVAQNGACP